MASCAYPDMLTLLCRRCAAVHLNITHETHPRNPGGVRFGSAEIYDVIEHCFAPGSTHAAHTIVDCVAVGQSIAGGTDERVILFVKLLEGQVLTEELEKRIKTEIRARRSARHVPARVSTIAFGAPVFVRRAARSRPVAERRKLGGDSSRDLGTLRAHVLFGGCADHPGRGYPVHREHEACGGAREKGQCMSGCLDGQLGRRGVVRDNVGAERFGRSSTVHR